VTQLIDTFGRMHDSLRISVTDRCNIRCFYCMPETPVKFEAREQLLTFEEIDRFVSIAARLGVRKLRVTGGEPLLRKNVSTLIRKLAAIAGIEDLALTTNGVLLAQQAEELYSAGLRRINVHLDTLDRQRFQQITRRDDFGRVMEGIETAKRIGYQVKINVVAVKDLIEPDIVPLALFGRERDIEIRYIEFMPLDSQGLWERGRVLLADEMIAMLERGIGPLEVIPDRDQRAPATEYRFADGIGRVGFIASVSRPFCLNCNRLRITADGQLRYCLFAVEETDIRALIRRNASDEEIAAAVGGSVRAKWLGHEINSARFVAPPRPMYSIGG
jgi:cyclic pyranopterin phosphate synthase